MFSKVNQIQPNPRTTRTKPPNVNHDFKHGDIIKATVIKRLSGKEVLVSARGNRFQANTRLHLNEGEKHHFRVINTGSKIELRMLNELIPKPGMPIPSRFFVGESGDTLSGILNHLSRLNSIEGLGEKSQIALKNLRDIFPLIIYRGSIQDSNLWLSRCLHNGGMFWENKILKYLLSGKKATINTLQSNDLKGLLLSLEKSLLADDKENDDIRSLALKTRQTIGFIEQEQSLNITNMKEGLGWCMYIPGADDDGFRHGEVAIKKGKEGEALNLTLFLEFTSLGRMEADVSINESMIGVNMRTDNAEVGDLITNNLYMLEKGLTDSGFTINAVTCEVQDMEGPEDGSASGVAGSHPLIHIVI